MSRSVVGMDAKRVQGIGFTALMGAAAGATLTAHREPRRAAIGALAGAVATAPRLTGRAGVRRQVD
ncbi:hypothetical protein Drose_11230 [Dactylosporangium roseum]|uniref:Uncharacterized protein n=1 Tax=Dactylosporangium roseum TaxID=47989 RepID=A0ABY5Z9G0_9ACTN|nr:hypothetical protein [Dactylosporangium roseum]UWZ38740.1 hypothetical protein Drose_11230 [Dactylosporangium roseum]